MLTGKELDKLQHEEALKRFGGKMPDGDTTITDQTPKEQGKVLRLKKVGKGQVITDRWS